MKALHLMTGALALMSICAATQAIAQSKPEFTMRYGGYLAGADPTNVTMGKAAKLIEERSKGRVKVDLFFDGKLGNEREVTEAVRLGTAELVATLGTGLAQYVPEVGVLELPFTASSASCATQIFLDVMPDVAALSVPKGFRPLTAWDIGPRGILTKKPVKTMADLAGMKLRGPAPLYLGTLKALGGNPVQMPWGDIYVGLQTGTIDGMEASPQMIQPSRFQEQAKYFLVTRHITPGYYLLVSESFWQKLPDDLKKVVQSSVDEAFGELRATSSKIWQDAADKMKAEGVQFIDMDDPKIFQKAVTDFRKDFAEKLGPKAADLYTKVQASAGKCSK